MCVCVYGGGLDQQNDVLTVIPLRGCVSHTSVLSGGPWPAAPASATCDFAPLWQSLSCTERVSCVSVCDRCALSGVGVSCCVRVVCTYCPSGHVLS